MSVNDLGRGGGLKALGKNESFFEAPNRKAKNMNSECRWGAWVFGQGQFLGNGGLRVLLTGPHMHFFCVLRIEVWGS